MSKECQVFACLYFANQTIDMDIAELRRERLREWFSDKTLPEKEKSYLSQLINGKASFGEKAALRLEKQYEMPVGYLTNIVEMTSDEHSQFIPAFSRSNDENLSNVRNAKPDTRRIPVLNRIPAGGPKQIIDDYHAGSGMEDIATDLDIGGYAFALIIDGNSMEPEFKTGDKVIIDPDIKPRPGDYVAAKCNGDEGTFKKYRPRGINADGIEVFELVPLNDDFPTIRSDFTRCEIIGTMVEHRRMRRA